MRYSGVCGDGQRLLCADAAGAVALKGGEIDDLVVLLKRRRRGLGGKLLRWAVHRLQAEGVEEITLHVADWNRGAMELYLQNGFVIEKTEIIVR